MKPYSLLLVLAMLLGTSLVFAAYTSPGWSYGYDIGISRGDNAGSAENLAPLVQGRVQLELFDFLYARIGMGFTPLHASKTYSTSTLYGDYRFVFQPYKKWKFNPFIYGGTGGSLDLSESKADIIPHFPMGIGVDTKLKPGMKLEIMAGYNLTNSDMLDSRLRKADETNSLTGDLQDGFWNLMVGLSFSDKGPQPAPPQVVTITPPPPPPAPKPVTPAPVVTPPPLVVTPVVPAVDPNTVDTDGDGLYDVDEIGKYNSDPRKADTDGDGLNDYTEVLKHKTDPRNPDTDGDGLKDGEEVLTYNTDPLNPDTDGDKLQDGAEVLKHKTNPLVKDTDKGTVDDGEEVARGTDPLDPKDDVLDLSSGASFSLEGIMFETGKATILPASETILQQAYAALAANPTVKIIIIGHTDNVGSAASNLTLSQNRAASVKTWLVNKGIAADRIKTEGKGLTEPRATNSTPQGRQLNRRIEFKVE